jgi:hypothetical protein
MDSKSFLPITAGNVDLGVTRPNGLVLTRFPGIISDDDSRGQKSKAIYSRTDYWVASASGCEVTPGPRCFIRIKDDSSLITQPTTIQEGKFEGAACSDTAGRDKIFLTSKILLRTVNDQ